MVEHHDVADVVHRFATAVHDRSLDTPVLTDTFEARCRRLARPWSIAAVAVFGMVASRLGAPEAAGYVAWQTTASLVALCVATTGLVLAWRWEGLGGTIALAGGVALGALAAIEYSWLLSLGAALVFGVPAVLFLLAWQRTTSAAAVLAVAAVFVGFMVAGGAVAYSFYQEGFGPAHPESSLVALPGGAVEWVWSGGVTDTAAAVAAKVPDASSVRLILTTESASSGRELAPSDRSGDVYRWQLGDLRPGTAYRYDIAVEGEIDKDRHGWFTTVATGPMSFTVAFGSCARIGSSGAVFDAIRASNPDLFVSTGDLYYGDVHGDSMSQFEDLYDATLSSPAQSALYRSVPTAYVWDDHDYGPNDAASDSPSREAALASYATYVPHYPPAFDVADGPISQAFSVGRVRFLLTDTRSMRTPQAEPDGPEKSMLGAEQLAWLQQELLASRDLYPVVVWVNTVPWIAETEPGADHWGGYATERATIAGFIAEHEIDNVLMLAGDAHMIAIDDGTNSDYSDTGGGGFPLFHAGALDRPGSDKGGPYSEGSYPGGGQYGLVTFHDDGGPAILVELQGLDWTGTELVSLDLTYDAGGLP